MESSYGDIIEKLSKIEAKEIPTQEINKINSDADFRTVLSTILINENQVLSVLDNKNKQVGFITLLNILEIFEPKHTDIKSVLTRKHSLSDTTAKDIAETHLPFIYDKTNLGQIAELMIKYEMEFLPRKSDRKDQSCKGVIRLKDIFEVCLEIIEKQPNL